MNRTLRKTRGFKLWHLPVVRTLLPSQCHVYRHVSTTHHLQSPELKSITLTLHSSAPSSSSPLCPMAAIGNLGNTDQMLLEPATNSNGAKIPELEIANFVARQDVEKWRRNCSALEEKVARLEEDCGVLREREVKDRERIRSLVEELERKERDFREKFVEVVELRRKCEELEGEVSGLKENAVKMLDEMPKRGKEDRVVTPEQKRSRELVAADSESQGESDDGVLLRQLKKKRVMEVGDEADKGDECKEPCDEGDTEVDEPADTHIPLKPMNGVKEV